MNLTPMMRQYQEAKRACPDALLLFRMGDFYEMFHEDARVAARTLGLALTSREKGADAIPMAGFPYHQLESYLGKLIAAGLRAAVCEQVEDPKLAKGLVRREVTRIVTPGTVTDDALLDPRESNFLAAVVPGDPAGLAWVEISTGRFVAAGVAGKTGTGETGTGSARERGDAAIAASDAVPVPVFSQTMIDQLARIAPAECLLAEDSPPLPPALNERMMVTRRPGWAFSEAAARELLAKHFGTANLEGFGFGDGAADAQALRAAGAVLDYLKETQKSSLAHVDRLVSYRTSGTLEIDEASRRSLEITRTMRDGRREGALLGVLDRTVTAMGSRLLSDWLANPLLDASAICARHEAVEELVADPSLCNDLQEALRRVYDVERLLARVATGRASPRDLSFLGRTLRALPAVKAKLTARRSPLLNQLESEVDLCPELRSKLDAALMDDCPLVSRDGGFIRDGYWPPLDELRELNRGGKQWIARYQAEETARTGIPNLKVGFNSVFGYYIEVTNTHREKIPENYIRKQTVKNAERYITPELKEYEEKVLTADEKAKQVEYDLFIELRDTVAAARRRMQATAAVLAQLDVLVSFSELARQRNYCRPTMVAAEKGDGSLLPERPEGGHRCAALVVAQKAPVPSFRRDEGQENGTGTVCRNGPAGAAHKRSQSPFPAPALRIIDGRHPVLDVIEPEGTFVPNDVEAGGEAGSILLITGPNMAGKSTYIRQVALLALMAQIGSFVPAREATIGVVDRIFARVGASDELSRGQSTFMVEMTETARILNTATPRSLVILDEIGRGTSTYDGISLAWSVVEYLHEHVGCRTLFATHYHELTDLEQSLPGVRNLNVAVREWQDEVVFLHKIVPGAADKSYGIHVARLAGVPREVIQRSKEILGQLEDEHLDAEGHAKIARPRPAEQQSHYQLTLFGPAEHPVLDEIRRLDLNATPPLAALQTIQQWQETLVREGRKAKKS